MAIIYTYPTKATLALADTVLISDSADANKTKNATITSIKDAIDVVDTFSSAFGTYITGTANAAATGAVDIGTLDLSAVDGTNAAYTTRFLGKNNEWLVPAKYAGGNEIGYVPTGGTAGNYLDGAGTWSTIDLTTDVNGILPASSGGTGGGSFTVGDLIYYGEPAFTRLATNGVTDGFVLTAASGVPTWAVSPSANPGGTADNQIQYKDGTAFAASSNITVAGVPNILVVRNIVRAGAYNGNQGKLEVFSNDNNTSVSLQGPPNGGSNYEIRMPSTLGTANQVLKLPSTIPGSGASQLTWGDATTGGLNDSNVSFTTGANGSLYVGQISTSITGTPVGNVTLGGGVAKIATTAFDNTLVGSDAAFAITEGSANVAIGSDVAATLTIGTNNVIIGDSANISGAALSSTTVIGQGASGAADSTVVGKGATASTNGIAIGSGATAAGGGIAIGKDASAAANEIELNGITSSIVATTGNTAAGDLKITINGTVYYIALRTYAP